MLDINSVEQTSHLWKDLFLENNLSLNGVVIEAAPGYEPKIGNALALLGFRGIIFVIEPDPKAAAHIRKVYNKVLPEAEVRTICKPLQEIKQGIDIYGKIDALVASHPFDDMVIDSIARKNSFFSEEHEEKVSPEMKKFYDKISDKEYKKAVHATAKTWKIFIARSKPSLFIASQYPSHTLAIKGLIRRQASGFAVLQKLKAFYRKFLVKRHYEDRFNFKGDPRWWIVAIDP